MEFIKNTKYEILTPDGFKDFDGIQIQKKDTIKITTKSSFIECTPDHKIHSNNNWTEAQNLQINNKITSKNNEEIITNIQKFTKQNVVDFINVKDNNCFYANDLLVHNCVYIDECIAGDSLVTIRNKETGKKEQIKIEELNNIL